MAKKKVGGIPPTGKKKDEPKKFTFACRSCGTQRSDQKDKCPACGAAEVPENRLEAMLREGKDLWQIVVQTYENGIQKNVSFVYDITGENCRIIDFPLTIPEVTTASVRMSDFQFPAKGVCIIAVPFKNKTRTAKFSIVGTKGTAQDLDIPAKQSRPRFESNLGFKETLKKFAEWRKKGK